MPENEDHELLLAEMLQTLLLSKLKQYFSFLKILSKNSKKSCQILFEKNSMHIATLPTEILGYIEITITALKPSHYRIIDSNTLIHSVFHTYLPEKTEPNIVPYD